MSGKRPSSARSRSRSVELTEPDIWCISRGRRGPGGRPGLVPELVEGDGEQVGQGRLLEHDPAPLPADEPGRVEAEQALAPVDGGHPDRHGVDEADLLAALLALGQPPHELRELQEPGLVQGPVADALADPDLVAGPRPGPRRGHPAGLDDLLLGAGGDGVAAGPGGVGVADQLDVLERVVALGSLVVAGEQVGHQQGGVLHAVGLLERALVPQALDDQPGLDRLEAGPVARLLPGDLGEQAFLDQLVDGIVGLGPADVGQLGQLGHAQRWPPEGGKVHPGLVAAEAELGQVLDELLLVRPAAVVGRHGGSLVATAQIGYPRASHSARPSPRRASTSWRSRRLAGSVSSGSASTSAKASARARLTQSKSSMSRASLRSERPDWRASNTVPSPRMRRSSLASSKPSLVRAMASMRARPSSVRGSANRMHSPGARPRPTRPLSWWSWDRPNRSASSISITVALGTSTPTSITVVETSTSTSPARKRSMVASFSLAGMSP